MRGHTPGPWRLTDEQKIRRVIQGGDPKKPHTVCIIETWTKDEDAALIAAAPELADALEAVRASAQCGCTLREAESGHRSDCWLPHWLRVAADALRKAGVQP